MATLDYTFLGNTARQWLAAVLIGLATILILATVLRLLRGRLAKLAGKTATALDDIALAALARTKGVFVLAVAIKVASTALAMPARAASLVASLTALVVLLQLGLWATLLLTGWLTHIASTSLKDDRGAVTAMGAVAFIGKVVLWAVVLLVALDNLGVNITTFVAGLGVGGIAIALAVQSILSDLFASLSIVLDKPFVIGDFLIVDDFLGTVEHVGLKTTRLRSLGGEQLVFANSELIKGRLRNYGRMYERRVAFKLGVTYQTPRELLARIPALVRESVAAQPRTRFDRSHFSQYGDFALTIETVYYVLSPDYTVYMDVQQAINLKIHERFEQEGIEFAYPTQTLFLTRPGTTRPRSASDPTNDVSE